MRAIGAVILALSLASSGCVYGVQSLPTQPGKSGEELPADAQAEKARRTSRRLWSFAAGTVELGLGALMKYATFKTNVENEQLFFDVVGDLFLTSGAGDFALATADSFVSTPFVDESGKFQPPEHFDADEVAPSGGLQADAALGTSVASQHRVEGHYDVALFHWVSPTLRLRYQLGFDRGVDFAGANVDYYGLGAGASVEWNPGQRRHFGRHPSSALVALLAPRAIVSLDSDTHFGWRALVGWELGPLTLGGGATQIVGVDRVPGFEAWLTVRPFPTD